MRPPARRPGVGSIGAACSCGSPPIARSRSPSRWSCSSRQASASLPRPPRWARRRLVEPGANKIAPDDIIAVNELTDTNLIVGQVLVLPGAQGAPMPTPTPQPAPRQVGGGGTGPAPRVTGSWAWPVVGGGNYISQYFHYG